jgi:hypothetical protein
MEITAISGSDFDGIQHTTPDHPGIKELNFSLGAVRKVIGLNVGELLKHYKLQASPQLTSIVPQ